MTDTDTYPVAPRIVLHPIVPYSKSGPLKMTRTYHYDQPITTYHIEMVGGDRVKRISLIQGVRTEDLADLRFDIAIAAATQAGLDQYETDALVRASERSEDGHPVLAHTFPLSLEQAQRIVVAVLRWRTEHWTDLLDQYEAEPDPVIESRRDTLMGRGA